MPPNYRGRFAPSPTGPLHFGSLLAAVGSWLDARASGGEWLLRIEDIDPPREPSGAASRIIHALERFELHWDGPVLFQSQRMGAYRAALETLTRAGLVYECACSRREIAVVNKGLGRPAAIYPGTCRARAPRRRRGSVLRLRTTPEPVELHDRLQGPLSQRLEDEVGDFVLRRREGYPAYQLAVVVDDHWQGITDVVRGVDLIDSTPRQVYLQQALGLARPRYMHLPVVVTAAGHKLSKQTGAAPLDLGQASLLAWQALECLGQGPPAELRGAPPSELWAWATPRWGPEPLAGRRSIPVPESFGCGAKI